MDQLRNNGRLRLESLEDRATPAMLPDGFTESVIADGIDRATAMEISPDGDVWVLEQRGLIKRFAPGSADADVIADIADLGLDFRGERGVLGIAFDPDFASNGEVLLYYTSTDSPNPHNRISRFTVDDSDPGDQWFVDTDAGTAGPDETVLVDLDPLSGRTNHNGGAIHFGPDGMLYAAVGDNAFGPDAQSLSNRHGKILRYNPDGTIPDDNPTEFDGVDGTTTGANRAIWALGLRNPFTFSFDPADGDMYINDVGQNTWEEINPGAPGANYGWPQTEGDFDPEENPDLTRPLYAYRHGGGTFEGFAITGGAAYSPETNQFPAEYQGDYFFADFARNWINVVDADGSNPRRFASNASSVVDLKVTPDGELLYLARGSGQVFSVEFTDSEAPAITEQPEDVTVSEGDDAEFTVAASGSDPLTYQWQRLDGDAWVDVGDDAPTLTLTDVTPGDAGDYRVVVSNDFGEATSEPAALTVTENQAPTAEIEITGGLAGGLFTAGVAVGFAGTATDPEDGDLPASAFTWEVNYITSIDTGEPVERPFVPPFSGEADGDFTPDASGPYTLADVAYRVILTVTDSAGLETTVTRDVFPNTAEVTLDASTPGLTLTLDGQPYEAPTTFVGVVGFERPLGAPSPQTLDGRTYTFLAWSDGGEQAHTISTPADDTTITAAFNQTPADITLTGDTVPENAAAGTAVGTFTADDDGDVTFELADGDGDDDNAAFRIEGDQLVAAETFDFEAQAEYTIRVRATDEAGGFFEKAFTVEVLDRQTVLSVADIAANEGDGGSAAFDFTLTSSGAVGVAFEVSVGTADGTANAGDDYDAAGGPVAFAGTADGETQTFTVTVNGDEAVELDETFFLDLLGVDSNDVTIEAARATGTILNDDEDGGNDPAAADDAAYTVAGVPVAGDVLANDTGLTSVTAVDGDAAAVGVPLSAAGGTLTVNADGSFAFTPAFTGGVTLAFSYTGTDGDGNVADAEVTVEVVAVPAGPFVGFVTAADGTLIDDVLVVSGTGGRDTARMQPSGPAGMSVSTNLGPARQTYTGVRAVRADLAGDYDLFLMSGRLDVPAYVELGDGGGMARTGGGDDVVLGGDGRDFISGGGGSDVLLGFGGNDFLLGGSGDDLLAGGTGRDFVSGGSGDDLLFDGGVVAESGELLAVLAAAAASGEADGLVAAFDGEGDILIGGAGVDAFWADGGDFVLAAPGETVTRG